MCRNVSNSFFIGCDFYQAEPGSLYINGTAPGIWPRVRLNSDGGGNVFRDCYFDGGEAQICIWANNTDMFDPFLLENVYGIDINNPWENILVTSDDMKVTATRAGDFQLQVSGDVTGWPYYSSENYLWAQYPASAPTGMKRYKINASSYSSSSGTTTINLDSTGPTLSNDASQILFREIKNLRGAIFTPINCFIPHGTVDNFVIGYEYAGTTLRSVQKGTFSINTTFTNNAYTTATAKITGFSINLYGPLTINPPSNIPEKTAICWCKRIDNTTIQFVIRNDSGSDWVVTSSDAWYYLHFV
jgi:hypothetical protein